MVYAVPLHGAIYISMMDDAQSGVGTTAMNYAGKSHKKLRLQSTVQTGQTDTRPNRTADARPLRSDA